jgi:PTS system ascorbate-specific IIC component
LIFPCCKSKLVVKLIASSTFLGLFSVVPHFFVGAAAGCYGAATGGLRGSVLGAGASGVLISILPMLLLPLLGELGLQATTFSDSDFGVIGLLIGWIVH